MKFQKIFQNLSVPKYEKISVLHQCQKWTVMLQIIPLLVKLAVLLSFQNIQSLKKLRFGSKLQAFWPLRSIEVIWGQFWIDIKRYPDAIGIGFAKSGTGTMVTFDCHSNIVYSDIEGCAFKPMAKAGFQNEISLSHWLRAIGVLLAPSSEY